LARGLPTEAPALIDVDRCEALARLEPLWDELFPAEQQRIVRSLVEGVTVGLDATGDRRSTTGTTGQIRLRVEGLASLVRDLRLSRAGAHREMSGALGSRPGASRPPHGPTLGRPNAARPRRPGAGSVAQPAVVVHLPADDAAMTPPIGGPGGQSGKG
jgi:hypothetical protein